MKIGSVHWYKNKPYFLFDQSENGLVFKDEEAYLNNWEAPCYVPENAACDAAVIVNGIEYECGGVKGQCDWYSHNDLLILCDYNYKICDRMFETLDWCYPETWLDEIDIFDFDYNYCYDFVKVGNKVYWIDPEGISSDYYDVVEIKDGNNKWCSDTIVVIANEFSEAEVFLKELAIESPCKILKQ